MINKEFFQALEDFAKEKIISKEVLVDALESGIAAAYKKEYGESKPIAADSTRKKQAVNVYAHRIVVEEVEDPDEQISLEEAHEIKPSYKVGDVVVEDITPKDFSRIAAQTAKQVIMQKLNDAKKEYVRNEMTERQGEILNAFVRRKEGPTVYVEISGSQMEGVMGAERPDPHRDLQRRRRHQGVHQEDPRGQERPAGDGVQKLRRLCQEGCLSWKCPRSRRVLSRSWAS